MFERRILAARLSILALLQINIAVMIGLVVMEKFRKMIFLF